MIARTIQSLTLLGLLAIGSTARAQGVYPYAGRPSGPRTVYYPAQPMKAAVTPLPGPGPVVAPVASPAGYASAAYAPTPYAGWAGTRPALGAQPLTWFPQAPAAAPVVAGYAPAAAVVQPPQAYIQPAGGGLIPAPQAAPVVAAPAPPLVSMPTPPAVSTYAPQIAASANAYAPITAYSPATTAPVYSVPGATAQPVAPSMPVAPAPVAAPVTAYNPVTSYSPVAPASGGYFPITVPGAAVGTTGTAVPGYVAYSNPHAKYYVPPVFAYRPYSKSIPVTYYRPVAAIDPASGQQVTYMAPCVGVEQQPYTQRRVFNYQQPAAATCGPQGCGASRCNQGTCGPAASPYYQPAPINTAPGVYVPGAGGPAASIPPSLPPATVIPTAPPPALPSTTFPPRALPSTTIPATPLPPAGTIPASPTFPGFNLPRTTIPPPGTIFPGTSGAMMAPPTTSTPGTSSTIRSVPGSSGADLAPRIDPNYIPNTPSNSSYPPLDDGARHNGNRTGVSPDAVLNRSEAAVTQPAERPMIRIPFHGGATQSPAPPQPPTPTGNPSFSAPLNGKTISEPSTRPRTVPVPDPDQPPVYNRAPKLINPRDKTA